MLLLICLDERNQLWNPPPSGGARVCGGGGGNKISCVSRVSGPIRWQRRRHTFSGADSSGLTENQRAHMKLISRRVQKRLLCAPLPSFVCLQPLLFSCFHLPPLLSQHSFFFNAQRELEESKPSPPPASTLTRWPFY